jgi:hypothetical protein
MKKTNRLAMVWAVVVLAGCATAPEQGATASQQGAMATSDTKAEFIKASFQPSARTRPQPFGYCDNGVDCGIDLEETTVNGQCALKPVDSDRIVIVHGRHGGPVTVFWYIPPALQSRYSFGPNDGITFKQAGQREFDRPTVVNAAEFSVRDKMNDKTQGFGYTIQVTKRGGETCIFDPIVVNDW